MRLLGRLRGELERLDGKQIIYKKDGSTLYQIRPNSRHNGNSMMLSLDKARRNQNIKPSYYCFGVHRMQHSLRCERA